MNTLDMSKEQLADLKVKRATSTPLWKGLAVLIKYRTSRNYRNPEFLGPRIGDKLIFSFLVATLYLGLGDKFKPSNYLNIAAIMFMWSTLPACAPTFSNLRVV
jgi:ATP-binding cassette, subfamily G (WHITE), member 2